MALKQETSRAVWILMSIFGAGAIYNVVRLVAMSFDHWDTSIPEVAIIYSILAVGSDQVAVYRDYTQFPYTTTPYGPLYYFFLGVITKILGGSTLTAYVVGRAASMTAYLGSVYIVFRIAGRLGSTFRAAFFAAILACALPIVFPWAISARPDFLALIFSLWGIWRVKDNGAMQPLVLLAWVAAFFMKPSFIAAPTLWVLYLAYKKDWRSAFNWCGMLAIVVVLGILLVEWITGGLFLFNIVKANVAQPSIDGLISLINFKLFNYGMFIFLLGAIGAFVIKQPNAIRREYTNLVSFFAVGSTIYFTFTALKPGAAENYFLEPLFLFAGLSGVAIDRLNSKTLASPKTNVALYCGLFLFVCLAPYQYMAKELEIALLKPGRKPLEKIIDQTKGEILFLSNGLGFRRGIGTTIHDGYNASYLETENILNTTEFATTIQASKYSAIIALTYEHYYNYSVIPPAIEDAMRGYYEPKGLYPPYRLYLPIKGIY